MIMYMMNVDAAPVSVTAPNETPNIDFSLVEGGIISGRVTTSDNLPIANVYVDAYAGTCWANHTAGGLTDENGDYSFRAPAGSCYVWANASWPTPRDYVNEWWDNTDGTTDCNQAESVAVTTAQTTPGIDFSLADAATITGTVTSDTGGQPIEGVEVCGWPFPGGSSQCTTTQSDGTYTLRGLQPGYIKVQASGAGYLTEYYDNSYAGKLGHSRAGDRRADHRRYRFFHGPIRLHFRDCLSE